MVPTARIDEYAKAGPAPDTPAKIAAYYKDGQAKGEFGHGIAGPGDKFFLVGRVEGNVVVTEVLAGIPAPIVGGFGLGAIVATAKPWPAAKSMPQVGEFPIHRMMGIAHSEAVKFQEAIEVFKKNGNVASFAGKVEIATAEAINNGLTIRNSAEKLEASPRMLVALSKEDAEAVKGLYDRWAGMKGDFADNIDEIAALNDQYLQITKNYILEIPNVRNVRE